MDRREGVHGFELNHQDTANVEIDLALADRLSLIKNFDPLATLKGNVADLQFDFEGIAVNRLAVTGAKMPMHFDCCPYHRMSHTIVVIAGFTPHITPPYRQVPSTQYNLSTAKDSKNAKNTKRT
jgi:hypothetical protein